ncbi:MULTISPECIES: polysaccharide biosynthesis tyrosine autokinase [Enterobacter]|jgi:tyrosine-protein kinase Etk/Wzc|uniref:polysaccharide biosynthesis tyrosine autokinase n=1 Tax=Enterobacter TaxID=547 RepID=UPI001C5E9775|nr:MULTISPECIES: polysaccharide biosynthesis tyrosine autokinase [Enterobacter]MCK6876010.1 polysaccharide biosynthesis tyrosine autokinase [Enterobacter bugandensis]MCU6169456.1 polysaccharide biosynthesis tyrosine autokinase [Enterobacter bugandensis]MDH0087017.1 polysaccharide biosynthesis tyrosine autokinase [Enterobacter bugandensis]MDH0109058.1 polysaccharide biosynthesis tyrosine autokinase [Enterobacter bugandensis]MDH0128840.1 polysaccharide biosynthesis tyrosine autokinase [Enterobac
MSSHKSDKFGAATPHDNEIDLIQLLAEMFDHRVMIACITLLFTVCAGIYAYSVTPIYQADALLQIEAKQDNSLLKSLSQFGTDLSPDVAPELLLLKSRMILGETVDKLGLTYSVKRRVLPVIGPLLERGRKAGELTIGALTLPLLEDKPQELLLTVQEQGRYHLEGKTLEADGVVGKTLVKDGVTLLVTSLSAAPGTRFALKTVTKLEAINALQRRLIVSESAKQSGIINLTLTGEDPDKIAVVLNTIAENYLSQNIARQEAKDTRSLTFLQDQLPKIRRELDEAEARLNAYREQRDSVDLSLEAKTVLDQVVNVENQLNELTFREAEVSQLFKKDHPTYRALRDKKQTLKQERTRLNNRVSSMPSTQQEILRLSRDVESGRTIYLQLLTRQQELNISRSSTIGNVRIIDPAVTQPGPVKPHKVIIIVLGMLVGLMLSAGTVLVRSAFKRGITSSEQLEAQGMPLLATLPRSVWLWKKTHLRRRTLFASHWKHRTSNVPFLPVDRPADIFVEAVRGLRTSLHFTMMNAVNRIVVISGPSQDCGKTLVSTSLASIAAQAGQRVLFIDADMRKGYVHNIFKLNNQHGLSSVLGGSIEWQDAIQRFEKGGFDVLTCGSQPSHPVELLMNERFQTVMSRIDKEYDIVIVDTPPVLAVTDALLVARAAATTLLVARFGKTSVKEIENCRKRLQQMGVQVEGAILNDIVKSAAFYYHSGYSHYNYGYTPE